MRRGGVSLSMRLGDPSIIVSLSRACTHKSHSPWAQFGFGSNAIIMVDMLAINKHQQKTREVRKWENTQGTSHRHYRHHIFANAAKGVAVFLSPLLSIFFSILNVFYFTSFRSPVVALFGAMPSHEKYVYGIHKLKLISTMAGGPQPPFTTAHTFWVCAAWKEVSRWKKHKIIFNHLEWRWANIEGQRRERRGRWKVCKSC